MKTKITLFSFFAFLFFMTGVKAQCTTGTKYPSNDFTTLNNGAVETINSNAYAGEYSIVTGIVSTRTYTFSSSISTDYVTITDSNNTVLAHGLSGLSWNSTISGTIKYFLHSNTQCTTQNTNRTRYITSVLTSACNAPTALNVSNKTSNSCQLNWSGASIAGYEIYISLSNVTPTSSVTITASSTATNKLISNLSQGTAYYYWIRTKCDSAQGIWTYGGTFTTNSFAACNGAEYGLYPTATFTPACSGNAEQIAADSWAGQYSNITIATGKKYTFSSSVATDYITITSADGTSVYATGTTPLVWSSSNGSEVIRYYIHSNSVCGIQNINRVKSVTCAEIICGAPSSVQASNITSNSCKISWSAPSVLPDGGYEVYISDSSSAPSSGTVATKTTTTNSINPINGLNPNTYYYYWVRSVCGTVKSAWIKGEGGFFRTNALLSCNGAANGLYPQETFTPAYTGAAEQIATDSWAGQYSNVNIMMHKQYTFTSSVASDYITITNDAGDEVYATGKTPLNWQSYVRSGRIRYYIHSNSSCAVQTTNRTRSITCVSTGQCQWPVGVYALHISSTSASIGWWFSNDSEPASSYQISVNSSPDAAPTTGTTTGGSSAISITANQLQPNTVYYFYVRKSCTGGGVTPWVSGGSFKTLSQIYQSCNGAFYGFFPTTFFTPANTGALELITDASAASQFSYVNIVADKQYTFQSSISTDYLTITNFEGTTVLAKGSSPLTWNSGSFSGPVRYYLHSQVACGSSSSTRSKYIKSTSLCITASAPTASNINTKSARLSWTGDSSSYQYYYSTVNSAPEDNYPTTTGVTTSKTVNLTNLIPGTTYYFWVRSVCNNQNSVWINGGSFTTFTGGCIAGTLFPSANFTPLCTGVSETITASAYAGEYSNVNVIPSTNYIFKSSVATDYITITNADATVLYAHGTTPLNWPSDTATGPIRFYIHSNADCGTQSANRTRTITCGVPVLGCNDTVNGLWPSEAFNLSCSGNNEVITTNAKTGQYSKVNIYSNKTYTFTSSVATDYVTITDVNGTVIYASGTTPLVWKSNAVSGTIRYHLNTNASCGVDQMERTKSVSCVHPFCNAVETVNVSNITSNSLTLEWASVTSAESYQYYISTQNVAPTESSIKNSSQIRVHLQELSPETVYYYWVRVKCTTGGNSTWTTGSFTTGKALQCNGTSVPSGSSGLYPSTIFTPACTGSAELISASSYAGEFSIIAVIPDKTYIFTSSVTTDYITVTSADGNTVLAHGMTPITWLSENNSGTVRFFIHTDASCGSANINRVKSVICAVPCTTLVTPEFAQVGPICSGASLNPLPVNSNNGIPGSWAPALNNMATTTYTFTPLLGQCATSTTMTINVITTPNITPTFTQVEPICSGASLSPLPVNSNNGIYGSWAPELNNTETTTYTFTPAPGQCALSTTMTIEMKDPTIIPTFTQVGPICSGSNINPLPVDSNNGIHGSWSPALNNKATTTYIFNPAPGQCAVFTTMTISVRTNPFITPEFTQVGPICSGSYISPLPVDSNNGIHGSWSPALNNTATTTYTFTPVPGQCAFTKTMTINVTSDPYITPEFTQVAPICIESNVSALPVDSNNGIHGSWSPAINNMATTTYTFTPAPGQCALSTTMTIIVKEANITPTFAQVGPICSEANISPLPVDSNNGIHGSWSPALNNMETTTYTFTPIPGQCALPTTMTIIVKDANITPTFTQVGPICSGSNISPLPVDSNNGIHGSWSPALNNKATTTYIFNPAPGQCAVFTTMTVTVTSNPYITPAFTQVGPICPGSSLSALPVDSNNGIHGSWSPALNNAATTTYTFTPIPGQCALTTTMTITVKDATPTFTAVAPICSGSLLSALPVESNNGIHGTWSPAINNTATTTYTFTPVQGQCAVQTTMTVIVYDNVPSVPIVEDVYVDDSYTLPTLTNGYYYTGSNGSGTMLEAGTVIYTSQTLFVYDTNGKCSDQTSFYVSVNQTENITTNNDRTDTLSKENSTNTEELKIYPNPSNGQFIIETGNISAEKITVIDSTGRVIKTVMPSSSRTDMNIAEFADGIYFIKIESKGTETTKRLVLKK
jgi:hypothetical protein